MKILITSGRSVALVPDKHPLQYGDIMVDPENLHVKHGDNFPWVPILAQGVTETIQMTLPGIETEEEFLQREGGGSALPEIWSKEWCKE